MLNNNVNPNNKWDVSEGMKAPNFWNSAYAQFFHYTYSVEDDPTIHLVVVEMSEANNHSRYLLYRTTNGYFLDQNPSDGPHTDIRGNPDRVLAFWGYKVDNKIVKSEPNKSPHRRMRKLYLK